jgi:hypothetical protein
MWSAPATLTISLMSVGDVCRKNMENTEMSRRINVIAAGIGAVAALGLSLGAGVAQAGTYPKQSTYDKPTNTCTKQNETLSQCDLRFKPGMTSITNNG